MSWIELDQRWVAERHNPIGWGRFRDELVQGGWFKACSDVSRGPPALAAACLAALENPSESPLLALGSSTEAERQRHVALAMGYLALAVQRLAGLPSTHAASVAVDW